MGPPDMPNQGTELYERVQHHATNFMKKEKGSEPLELSLVLNPDPSQLSFILSYKSFS